MEPVSMLGLASAVVTFIDFGSKVLKSSREIYLSTNGQTAEMSELSDSVARLSGLCSSINSQHTDRSNQLCQDEAAVKEVAEKCLHLADELRELLKDLSTPGSGFWNATRKASLQVVKGGKIRNLQQRLQDHYRELHLHLGAIMYQEHSTVMQRLQGILNANADFTIAQGKGLKQMCADLRQAINLRQGNSLDEQDGLENLCTKIRHVDSEMNDAEKVQMLLRSLSFPEMDDRWLSVREAHEDTFSWIFQDTHDGLAVGFKTWLESKENRFWIQGKPGSGKSSLMKYTFHEEQTASLLRSWAKNEKLIIASFFFWRAGSNLEKSSEGLFRSLLWKILCQAPELASQVLSSNKRYQTSNQLSHQHWTNGNLTEIFQKLATVGESQTKFCFFIDGLDEFEGEPREIAKAVNALASSPRIKICMSSRAWLAFEAEFRDCSTLKVHEHTAADIELYIKDVLGKDSLFQSLNSRSLAYERVITSLVSKAQGVFLWVYLVVKNLVSSLPNADSADEMLIRIAQLPSDLEDYFELIFRNIPDFYKKETCQILLVALDIPEVSPPLLVVYLLLASTPQHKKEEMWTLAELESETPAIIQRLLARSQDFIDMTRDIRLRDQSLWDRRTSMELIHRSVADYLSSSSMQQNLRASAGVDFSCYWSLFLAYCDLSRIYPFAECRMMEKFPSDPFCKQIPMNPHNIFNTICFCAREIQEAPREAYLEAMRTADKTLNRIATQAQLDYRWDALFLLKESSRSQQSKPRNPGPTLLSYAIRFGLQIYVAEKLHSLKQADSGHCIDDISGIPSLIRSLFPVLGGIHIDSSGYWRGRDVEDYFPKLPIIKVLLEAGANPNKRYKNKTTWIHFLENLADLESALYREDRLIYVQAMKLLMDHGADPNVNMRSTGEEADLIRPGAVRSPAEMMSVRSFLSFLERDSQSEKASNLYLVDFFDLRMIDPSEDSSELFMAVECQFWSHI